ncbi:MAG TPA: O-antigen ligase family protein [Ktedonobacterales bacterium]|jgi:hypothetical protein
MNMLPIFTEPRRHPDRAALADRPPDQSLDQPAHHASAARQPLARIFVSPQRERRETNWVYLAILSLALGVAPLLMLGGAASGFTTMLALLGGVVLVALIWWRPIIGLYVIAFCAVVIEQEPLPYNIFTDRLNIFYWPPRLDGVMPERPIGFLLLFIFLLIIFQRLLARKRVLRGGALLWPFLFLLACVVMGIARGLTSGGTLRIIVLEVRPFWYLFLAYLLAYNLVTEKRHVRTLLWITILGTGIKALQGVYIVVGPLHGHIQGQNEIMAHEQSFFFVLILLLIALFSLHKRYWPQLAACLVILPFLLVALVANNRRADYSALALGVVVAWLLIIIAKPKARKGLITGLVISAALAGAYVLVFQHVNGSLGEPARAVISVIHPSASDARDAASNLYRYVEDYDLKYTEAQSPITGYGFGKPFIQPLVLPNIVDLDPYYLFIPHNNVLWIWMRLGPLGYLAFFYLLGAAIIRGSQMVRRLKDPMLQLMAIFVVATIFIEVPLAYGDYQLFFYRNILYIGILLGVLMKLPHLDDAAPASSATPPNQENTTPTHETAHGHTPPAPALVGGGRP